MKFCYRCKTEKSLDEFFPTKGRRDGVSVYCRPCHLEYQREYYTNPEAHKRHKMRLEESKERRAASAVKYRLKKNYGLTPEQYAALLTKHNGGCWICGKTSERNLHVDHDHSCCDGEKSCGKCIRGLLCYNCNSLLGHARDNIDTLQSAIMYLTTKE